MTDDTTEKIGFIAFLCFVIAGSSVLCAIAVAILRDIWIRGACQ